MMQLQEPSQHDGDWLKYPKNRLISACKGSYSGFLRFIQIKISIFHRASTAHTKDPSWRPKIRVTPARLDLPWSWPLAALEGTELQPVVAAKRRRLLWELQRLETVMPGRWRQGGW